MGLFDGLFGGGKSTTTTTQTTIPPEVLEQYRNVMELANLVARQEFQPYTGEFVAPLTETQRAGIANINQAAGLGQPYYEGAKAALLGSASQAQPYYDEATGRVGAGLAGAQPLQQASMANQLAGQAAGTQALQTGLGASQPVMQGALAGLSNIPVQSLPLQQQALLGVTRAQAGADPYQQAAYGSLMQGATQAQPYISGAAQALGRGEFAAQPMQQMASEGISSALAAGAPYQQLATQYGLSAARQIDPSALNVQRYMSPFIEAVAQPTLRALQQQQQQEQQKIVGDQIRSGAFGGDRGKIAQAVLAQQQGLATSQALGNLYQQGYGQALSTAQQQQQTALAAEQANRAAQQAAAQQMLGIGQQGYGQQLGAAQQQAALAQQLFGQGLAGSQQRAALGQQVFGQGAQTSQQQAALAQQLYNQGLSGSQVQQAVAQQLINQGLGVAGQQAGIGQNLFGQGAQTAQQLYGMGSGTAQQQAALAQQQYAQQMGAAQQLQGLGQGLYGIGAGVSQGLAGLGGAAQQAALQGGQAQLAAGSLEQQTNQALDTAKYNQFLQQQGYPFQSTQFVGNLAMGTGALSGSTTTATQPSSFWSDKKLKQDIEPIGKTYDGQDIVRYKYKGEPTTHIGLIAQDVEKKHPGAVGLAGGYKTVDYKKATDEAADRAHKASGGGLNPWSDASMGGSVFREDAGLGFAAGGTPENDILAQINQLVNAHQGIYPFGKTGLYGSTSGKSGPYGSSLMQVTPRMITGPTPPRPIEPQAAKFLENVGKVGSAVESGSKGASWLGRQSSLSPEYQAQGPTPSGDPVSSSPQTIADYLDRARRFLSSSSSGAAHGGAIRPGLAIGGMPFSEADNEYIPEELTRPFRPQTLQAPKAVAPQQSGLGSLMGGLGDIGKAAEGIGKIGEGAGKVIQFGEKVAPYLAAMFLSRGGLAGRHGYQDGGEPTVPEEWRSHISEASRRFGVPEYVLTAVARQESGLGRAAPDNPMQITEGTARNPGFGLSPIALEDRARPEAFIPFSAQYIAARNPNVNWEDRPATARALAATYNAGGDPNYAYNVGRYLPGISADDLAALRVNTQNQGLGAAASSNISRPEAPPILQGLAARREPENKDFMQRNQDWIVPLLTGLGTMASSPSRYLGSSILQGLAGGALQYAGMQERGEGQAIQREQVDVSRLREINQAMQLQEQMRQRLLESFGPRLEGNQYLNPYSGEMVSAQQRMAIVNSMMSNMARQMGLPAMTGAEAAGGMQPGQRPGQAPQQPPAGGATQPPAGGAAAPGASGAAGTAGLATPASGTERSGPPDASAIGAGRGPDISTAFNVDTSSLRGLNNPDSLEQEAAALMNRAAAAVQQGLPSNAELYQRQADEKLKRAGEIRSGARPVVDVNGRIFRGFAQAARDQRRYEEEQTNVEKEYARFADNGIKSFNALENAAEIYQRPVDQGAGARQLAALAGYFRSALSFGDINPPAAVNRFINAVNEADKTAIQQAFANLSTSHMSRGTNMALQEMMAMVANPELGAGARYAIITRSMAEIARDRAFYDAAMQRDPRESIGTFQSRWNENPENSLQRFVQNVRSRTVGFTGMTPEDVRLYGAASTAIPENLQGRQGVEYDRQLGIFRVPSNQQSGSGEPTYEYFLPNGQRAQAPTASRRP